MMIQTTEGQRLIERHLHRGWARSTRSWTTGSLSLLFLLLSLPLCAQVHFVEKSDRITIHVNGKLFSNLYFGKQVGKPYLHPLMTASGKAVTRGFPDEPLAGDPIDRPHLRGVIVGAEKLIGPTGGLQDFWENDPDPYYAARPKGNIVLQQAKGVDGADRGTLSMVAHWISKEGQLWVIERRKMTFYAKPAERRMLDIELELEAAEDVTFADDKDTILGLRLALPFDTHYEGRAINAAGQVNEQGARGWRSPWIDWVGDLVGEKVGVAVYDHPSNRNYPNRWHIKDFGQMNLGPFGGRVYQEYPSADPKAYRESWELRLKRGEKLNLKYRILVYTADGPAAGKLVSDLERLLDKAKRPSVDPIVYEVFNDWVNQK